MIEHDDELGCVLSKIELKCKYLYTYICID